MRKTIQITRRLDLYLTIGDSNKQPSALLPPLMAGATPSGADLSGPALASFLALPAHGGTMNPGSGLITPGFTFFDPQGKVVSFQLLSLKGELSFTVRPYPNNSFPNRQSIYPNASLRNFPLQTVVSIGNLNQDTSLVTVVNAPNGGTEQSEVPAYNVDLLNAGPSLVLAGVPNNFNWQLNGVLGAGQAAGSIRSLGMNHELLCADYNTADFPSFPGVAVLEETVVMEVNLAITANLNGTTPRVSAYLPGFPSDGFGGPMNLICANNASPNRYFVNPAVPFGLDAAVVSTFDDQSDEFNQVQANVSIGVPSGPFSATQYLSVRATNENLQL